MSGRKISIPGFKLDKKTGKPVRDIKVYDASKQRRIAASKKVKVARRTTP